MPKIFERDGYIFYFYSNEHQPIHVHVRYGNGEAIFECDPEIVLKDSSGLKVKELSKAQDLAESHRELILE